MGKDVFAPKTWDEFIGQDNLKRRLAVRTKAAREQWRLMPHMLLTGPPGMGKTTLAGIIAQELLAYHDSYVMPIPIESVLNLCATHNGVLSLDEIHRLPRKQQEELLPVTQEGVIQRHWGKEPITQPLMIIGMTTEVDQVVKPLRDRLIMPPFEDYTDEEMARMVVQMGRKVDIEFTEDTALTLGKAAAGSPRQATHLVEAARDLEDPNEAAAVLDLMGVTPEGLSVHHLKYLKALRKSSKGKAGLKVLAATVGLPEGEIIDLESSLRRLDFIENTAGGRMLTGNGYKYMHNLEVASS